MLLVGQANLENKLDVVIGIEAKVNESFGNDTIKDYYLQSKLKQFNGSNNKVPQRIEELIKSLFITPVQAEVWDIQYQLLTSTAGVLADAKKLNAKHAVLLIQTIQTKKTNALSKAKNDADLNQFIKVISRGKLSVLHNKVLAGPFTVPGNNEYISPDIPFYVGKIET